MAFVDQKNSSRQALSVAAVVMVHLAIGYAFVVGLAYHFFKPPEVIIEAYPVPEKKPPPPLPKVPPKPHQDARIKPLVDTATDQQTKTIDPSVETRPKNVDTTIAPSQPTKGLERALQARSDRPQWITTEDYPSSAIREGEEGYVAISVTVGPTGRVTSCTVTGSSGHPSLDETTCRLYVKRARFIPALGKDGTPIEASHADRVRWQLPAE